MDTTMQETSFQNFLSRARFLERSLQSPGNVVAKPNAIANTLISWVGPHGWKQHIKRGKDLLVAEHARELEKNNLQQIDILANSIINVLVSSYCYDRVKLRQVPSEKLITRLRASLRRGNGQAQIRSLIEVLQSLQEIEIYNDKRCIPPSNKCGSVRLFISYSRMDHAVVHEVSRFLEQRGFDYFLDDKRISAGEQITLKVSQALTECSHFILFWSKHAAASEFVASEWSVAYTQEVLQKTKLILVLLDGTQPPALLSAKRYVEIINGKFARALSELMSALTQK